MTTITTAAPPPADTDAIVDLHRRLDALAVSAWLLGREMDAVVGERPSHAIPGSNRPAPWTRSISPRPQAHVSRMFIAQNKRYLG